MAADRLYAAIAYLAAFYPRQPPSGEFCDVLAAELADLPVDAVEAGVRALVRTSRYFPTLAEIRAAAADAAYPLPGEDEALAQVERYLRAESTEARCPDCAGRWREPPCARCRGEGLVVERAAAPLHPLVRAALDLVGGPYAFRSADKPAVVRGQFLRLYCEARARGQRDAAVGQLPSGPLEVPGLPSVSLRRLTP